MTVGKLVKIIPSVFFVSMMTVVVVLAWVEDGEFMQSWSSFVLGFTYAILVGFCVCMAMWKPKGES